MRISTKLSDPRLVGLLRLEAHESGITIEEILTRALEAWFAGRRENRMHLAERSFSEWDDPRDADYDRL